MLDTFDIWDLFIGIFGLLTSIPIITQYIYGQFPTQKLDTLFATLAQTDTLLHGCVEEGLLKSHEVQEFRTVLKRSA